MAQSDAHKPGPARRATYQDVLDAPPQLVAEIIHGTLYTSPRPAPRHAKARTVLGAVLNSLFHTGTDGPGGWWILFGPELHFGEQVLVPDIAGWRRERMGQVPILLEKRSGESAPFAFFPRPDEERYSSARS